MYIFPSNAKFYALSNNKYRVGRGKQNVQRHVGGIPLAPVGTGVAGTSPLHVDQDDDGEKQDALVPPQ